MRILVVEDDELTASALERGLAAEGYAVEVASDGIDGLHRAKEFAYDAMILDLMLPGISGLAVCSELRAAGRDLPVLMLTALGDPADHTAGLDIGADDYIVKPFKFPVLLAHLRALLRRGPARLPAVLVNGSLALDPARHVCTQAGRVLDLTPREFAVLRYLMSHAGTTVSKQELLDHVWGENDSADHNVVQVYVSSLRRKLDSDGAELAHRDRLGRRLPNARRHLMRGFPALWRSSIRLRLTVAGVSLARRDLRGRRDRHHHPVQPVAHAVRPALHRADRYRHRVADRRSVAAGSHPDADRPRRAARAGARHARQRGDGRPVIGGEGRDVPAARRAQPAAGDDRQPLGCSAAQAPPSTRSG